MKVFSKKGFTLLELMIVIAIMAIMAAIAVPNYRTFMADLRPDLVPHLKLEFCHFMFFN